MISDRLRSPTDREEALSRAYLPAVAAGAGYLVATRDFDRDGIDCEIQAGGQMRPSLGIQLKATVDRGESRDRSFRILLKRRNYDWLRAPSQFGLGAHSEPSSAHALCRAVTRHLHIYAACRVTLR